MQARYTNILILILALFTANIGIARAELLLCQTRCDYLEQDATAIAPCCPNKAQTQVHAMAGTMGLIDHEAEAGCPHLQNSKKVSGSLAFASGQAKQPVPEKTPALSGAVIDPGTALYLATSARRHQSPVGLSPPGILGPPPYRLNCSFLI